MKYAVKISILVFCALALASTCALADGCSMGKCDMMHKNGKMMSKMDRGDMFSCKARFIVEKASELGLSDDQVEKVTALKYSVKKNLIRKDADIETLALDIKEALGKDEVDLKAVNSLIDKKYAVKAEKTKDLIEACVNVKRILTKDQQKKLKELCSGCAMGKKS